MSTPKLYQIVPSDICLSCDVCCRFLESDSPLAPIFRKKEREQVISQGADPTMFVPQQDGRSTQIRLTPYKDFYLCPFFEPETSKCTIYDKRPLDCQLYPFALMYDEDKNRVVLGIDTLCPFTDEQLFSDAFQKFIKHVIDYVESDEIRTQISTNWSLIGEYQDTVKVFHTLKINLPHAITSANP